MKRGDEVLANTIDGLVLCTVLGVDNEGRLELEPVNNNAAWGKCWIKPDNCKLVKAAPILKIAK